MTHVIQAENVNDALADALWWLKAAGRVKDSRNGRVIYSPDPVITEYLNPKQRVLFSPLRDANPFFHLMESLWMLAGREDVALPATFAKQIAEYSDDGLTLNGAYGFRWRNYFNCDQLGFVISELQQATPSRRAVLGMWDPASDPLAAMNGSKDVPCNTHIYFSRRDQFLDMMVCCRSNDVVWGAYGANAVHFSVLHEYVAACSQLSVGIYRQLSNDLHIYIDRPDVQRLFDGESVFYNSDNRYAIGLAHVPLISTDQRSWMYDLSRFMQSIDEGRATEQPYVDRFFSAVAQPMALAFRHYKDGNYQLAGKYALQIEAEDWRIAASDWILRRLRNKGVI